MAISLILLYVLTNVIHVCDASSAACEEYGIGNDVESFRTVFFISVLMVMALILGVGVHKLMITASARGLELKLLSTGSPPVLRNDEVIIYHLFLSHIWSSGQDQANRSDS